MKNLLTLIIALGFVFGFASCGGTATQDGHETEATESVEATDGTNLEDMDADSVEVATDTTNVESNQ